MGPLGLAPMLMFLSSTFGVCMVQKKTFEDGLLKGLQESYAGKKGSQGLSWLEKDLKHPRGDSVGCRCLFLSKKAFWLILGGSE